MGARSYLKKRQAQTNAMSDEEYDARWKIARYGAIFIVVVGLGYFLLKRFVFDKDDKDDGGGGGFPDTGGFIIRDCNFIEVVSDTPCGLKIKTPDGKYCCLP